MAVRHPTTKTQDTRDYIQVVSCDGRNAQIFVKNFSKTTIKKLKPILEWEFDCEKEDIKLQLGAVRLDDDDRCLSDYNIRNKDKLFLSLMLRGGHLKCGRILFTDKIILAGEQGSAEGITKMKMCDVGPRYHVVTRGLNFLARCNEGSCFSQGNIVAVKIGLMKDPIDFSYYLQKKLICPVCGTHIPSAKCIGMGLHMCRARIEYMTDDGKDGEYELKVGDEFHQFVSTLEDKIEYQYIRITLKPFECNAN